MSMETYVLCSHPIGSLEEWQGAIDALGFGLRFRAGGGLSGHAGHLPAVWRGQEAGFELYSCSSEDVAELSDDLDLDLGGPWPFSYAFRYGGMSGCVGTWFAVAACLQLTGGIAVEGEEGKILKPEEAIPFAWETEVSMMRMERDMVGDVRA